MKYTELELHSHPLWSRGGELCAWTSFPPIYTGWPGLPFSVVELQQEGTVSTWHGGDTEQVLRKFQQTGNASLLSDKVGA